MLSSCLVCVLAPILIPFINEGVNGEATAFRYVTVYNKEGHLVRKEELSKTSVNVLRPIIFIINVLDGDSQGHSVVMDLTEEYLKRQQHNVFLVNGPFGTEAGTDKIQLEVVDFISVMYNRTGESYLDIHLVGVLGAGSRVALAASKRLYEFTGRKVNRITGLDPTHNLINDEEAKPDAENANFVDVVYRGKAQEGHLGHVRFYLDCSDSDLGALTSVKLFAKSINSAQLKGVKCASTGALRAGECGQNATVVFGEGVERSARGNYLVVGC